MLFLPVPAALDCNRQKKRRFIRIPMDICAFSGYNIRTKTRLFLQNAVRMHGPTHFVPLLMEE